MKSNSLFVASRERHAGSLVVSLGLMALLHQHFEKVAFFRPIAPHTEDPDCQFMQRFFGLNLSVQQMIGVTLAQATELLSQDRKHELYEVLIEQYQTLLKEHDFVLIQGMDLSRQAASIDFDINLQLAKHFNSPFIPVLNARGKSAHVIGQDLEMELHSTKSEHFEPFCIFVNRMEDQLAAYSHKAFTLPIFYLPEINDLDTPTVKEVAQALQGTPIFGSEQDTGLSRLVRAPLVAAMTVENYLERVKEGDLIIVPGDRTDILTASVMSLLSRNFPNIAGILLTGGLTPQPIIKNLLTGFQNHDIALVSVQTDTYPTAVKTTQVRAQLDANNESKINIALGLFDQWVNRTCLVDHFQSHKRQVMTPLMFEYSLFEKARQNLKTIVLPEAEDDRVLRACEILLHRQVVKPILLGKAEDIEYRCNLLGIQLQGVEIIDPETSPWKTEFIETLYQMRHHKGMTRDLARDSISHINYFATMMVQLGYADGMVSGATHTTADTVRPALQIIKTQPNTSLVSSVFFMCFDAKVLVYGDCAVNQNPNADQLAEIAISSAQTAQQFDITPKVALLSYSTGQSGQGSEVEKVRQASQKAQARAPELLLEGPLQYDAAIDPQVAQQKLPNSSVAGQATVFVFPDLNTGNNTYKAVQRASGAIAIGPVLQGLNKPVNDLSRGCLVDDIVNTVAITAIQAQQA